MKTKIMAAVLLVALIFAWQPAQAKDEHEDDGDKHELITIKYCDSYEEFNNDNWHTTDSVWLITKSRSKQYVNGGCDYVFKSDNKELNKHLKKNAFAVMYNDTLLINAWIYKVAAGYARGFRMTDGRLIFKYFPNQNMKIMGGGLAGGLMGSLAVMAANEHKAYKDVCYLIAPEQRDATVIDKKVMAELLKDYPELLTEYNTVKKKDRKYASIILPLLSKAKLLKEE